MKFFDEWRKYKFRKSRTLLWENFLEIRKEIL